MIDEARRCAEEAGSKAKFIQSEANKLPFVDDSFDYAVLRNSLWAMDEPKKVLEEASRVLKKEGSIIIIDAPWIERLSTQKPKMNDDGVRIRSGETGFGGTDLIDPIFMNLPLTMESRPEWDCNRLKDMRFQITWQESMDDMLVDRSIHEIVGDSFVIIAVKK